MGHSFGSGQTYALSAMYPDITDGIVLTGFSMNLTFVPYFVAGANFMQAQTALHKNATASNSTYPPGYLFSSNANANLFLFFYPGHFDTNILAFAEQTKKPVTIGELLTMSSVPMEYPFSGPVLFVTGSVASILQEGKTAFPMASAFEAHIQPHTGHGINMHYNATGAYNHIAGFLKANWLGAQAFFFFFLPLALYSRLIFFPVMFWFMA